MISKYFRLLLTSVNLKDDSISSSLVYYSMDMSNFTNKWEIIETNIPKTTGI